MSRLVCAVSFVCVGIVSVIEAEPQNADGARAAIHDVDGQSVTGNIVSLTDERLSIAGRPNRTWETADLLKVEFAGRRSGADIPGPVPKRTGVSGGGAVVFLQNGDRLAGTPAVMDEGHLVVAWSEYPSWPPVQVPLETIRGMVLDVPDVESVRQRTFTRLLDEKRTDDVVYLKNRDRLAGELLGLDGGALKLETAVGETEVQRSGIRAVGLNCELISFPEASGKRMLFTLRDGSRVTGRNVRLAPDGQLHMEALFGTELMVPISAVVTIRFLGGRAVYLSDLEPAQYHFTPFLSTHWPLKADRNVIGGPLRLGGREYPKGLGMHSRCTATYELDGEDRVFQAVIGLDDAAADQGSAIFAVAVDGERIFESDVLTGADPPTAIDPIPLEGAKRLTLIVEFGPFGDIRDYADWGDAVLIRSSPIDPAGK